MAQATQDSTEDLIILDDVDTSTTEEIAKTEELPVSDEVITFDDEPTQALDNLESKSDITLESEELAPETNLDASLEEIPAVELDFSALGSSNEEESKKEEEKSPEQDVSTESLDLTDSLNLDISTEEKPEEIVENKLEDNESLSLDTSDISMWETSLTSSDEESMEDIISSTIAKLQSRQEELDSEISTNEKLVSNLKKDKAESIKEFDTQIEAWEALISGLKDKSTKTRDNVVSMEKMITSDIEAKSNETSMKVHNLKRKAA